MDEQGTGERAEAAGGPANPPAPKPAPPPLPVLDYHTPAPPQVPSLTSSQRFLCSMVGIVLPLACFVIAGGMGYPEAPAWQSGEMRHQAAMLLHKLAPAPFYPLLIWSMLAMWDICTARQPPRVSAFTRLGLYGGVFLALTYSVLQALALGIPPMLVVPAVIGSSAGILAAIWGLTRVRLHFLALALSLGLLVAAVPASLVFVLALAPAFTVAAYAAASWVAWRSSPSGRAATAMSIGMVGWLAGWLVAFRVSVAIAMSNYAKLPTGAPDRACYVATAAARGHRWFVRSEQLRQLKILELTIQQLWPAAHRSIRRAYDRLGPPLARQIDSPYLADLAYLSLKPAEWLAAGIVRAATSTNY